MLESSLSFINSKHSKLQTFKFCAYGIIVESVFRWPRKGRIADALKTISRWRLAVDALDLKTPSKMPVRFNFLRTILVSSTPSGAIEHAQEDGDSYALYEYRQVLKQGGIALNESSIRTSRTPTQKRPLPELP